MATETGVITSINEDRSYAQIKSDATGGILKAANPGPNMDVNEGVSFESDGKIATKVKIITVVKSTGDLTADETKMLDQLVSAINGRGGGGGIKINIKTKM